MFSRLHPFFIFATALLFLLVAVPGHGQSLNLSPAVVPLKGHAGQSVTQELTLRNDADQALDFTLEADDVIVRDGARVFVKAGNLADSIAATAVFSVPRVHVPAHSSATVTVTLTLPPALRHRAVVVYFRGTTLVNAGARQATLSLGTLFTFAISDHVSLAAGGLDIKPPSASANTQVQTALFNDGSEPLVASGMAVLLDAGGRLVGKVPLPPRRLLPGEKTLLAADYPGELHAGAYRAVATINAEGRATTLSASFAVP
ncbi:MAG: putative lipoprotein [Paucimonas sp.]|nr:putative lipoprotein [Paucimonas sp.]